MANAWRCALVCGLLSSVALSGCSTGFATYPPTPGQMASDNPNGRPFESAMVVALGEVIERYPPPQELIPRDAGTLARPERIAINLLPGVRPVVAERTAERIGLGTAPYFEATADLPTYHVKRVWLRGPRAEVDIIHPLVTRRGARTTRMVTVEMRGTVGAYRVTRVREWTAGAFDTPEPFGYILSSELAAQESAYLEAAGVARRLEREAADAEADATRLSERAAEAEAEARALEAEALEDDSRAGRAQRAWADAADLQTRAREAAQRAEALAASATAARAEAERLRPELGQYAAEADD